MLKIFFFALQTLTLINIISAKPDFDYPQFPKDFLFGTSTSSFQIEGAWNVSGKSTSIWDTAVHKDPNQVLDKCNADDTCNSYYLYKRDVEMLRELGVDFYRFSLSWPRILPMGRPNFVNELGLKYYNNLIDELLLHNIQPMITLYHWDLPQVIEDDGGFLNENFPIWFEEYAKVVFDAFGDRVKYWNTFNEPLEICIQGYGMKMRAPQRNLHGYGEYLCTANLLGAHARAYHLYNTTYKPTQEGVVGISISAQWAEPLTDSEEDINAAENSIQFDAGIFIHPIFSADGRYPPQVLARVDKNRLPEPPAYPDIRNTADFIGVNHYDVYFTSKNGPKEELPIPSFHGDLDVSVRWIKRWSKEWMKVGPSAFGKLLHWFKKNTNNALLIVCENGIPTGPGLDDKNRVWHFRRYLAEVLKSIEEGVRIQGFAAWTLMDNFEWFNGYAHRYGLFQINFDDPNKTRVPRRSAAMYKRIIETRTIEPDYQNEIDWPDGEELENLCEFRFVPIFDTNPSLGRALTNTKTTKGYKNISSINIIIEALQSQVLTFNMYT